MSSNSMLFQRARWRRRQRGAAVFVVMLVVILLTGLGLMAVRSASLATRASGFGRQLSQTHFVTDYAMVGMVADMITYPDVYAHRLTQCPSPPCELTHSYDDLEGTVQKYDSNNVLLVPASFSDPQKMNLTAPGSLGPAAVEGDMKLQISDYHRLDWPIPGFSAAAKNSASQQFVMITVTATGMVRPAQATSNTWDTNSATAAGIETSRAHVILTVNR